MCVRSSLLSAGNGLFLFSVHNKQHKHTISNLETLERPPARRRRRDDAKVRRHRGARRLHGLQSMPGRVDAEEDDNAASSSPSLVAAASFLTVGQVFSGSQTVNGTPAVNGAAAKTTGEWRVNVTVQGVDFEKGTVCGSMEALDVPSAQAPVLTFWRGEIIDNRNYFFWTDRWNAQLKDDVRHWGEFRAFAPLKDRVRRDRGDDIDLAHCRHIFMRWKEIFFVGPGEDCGLTIAGFYYVCMDRQTGAIVGYYYDPTNQPWQRLELTAQPTANGFAFAEYEFN